MKRHPNQGKKVKTIEGLYAAALDKKAVFCPGARCFQARIPAAFVLSMQGTLIVRLIMSGLYIYNKKPKTKTK